MKHSIRQRVLDPVTGLKVTKIETVNGELGSGIVDKNGREIFEGDILKDKYGDTFEGVFFKAGAFSIYGYKDGELEVIGHVDD